MNNQSSLRPVICVTLMAVSVVILWTMLAGWVLSIIEPWFRTTAYRYEQIHVAADGTPLIAARDILDWQNVDYFTLDRQPVKLEVETGLTAASLAGTYQPPGIFQRPIGWRERIGGLPNFSKPFLAWYAIRDAKRPGRLFFQAFDPVTNLPTTYASKSGVGVTPPRYEDWFEVGEHGNLTNTIVSGNYFWLGQYAYNQGVASDEGAILSWMVYIRDGDQLLELDMRNKRLRTLTELTGLLSHSLVSEPLAKNDLPPAPADDDPQDQPTERSDPLRVRPVVLYQQDVLTVDSVVPLTASTGFLSITPGIDSTKHKTRRRLAVRGAEEVLLIDPKTDKIDRFKLPASLRDSESLAVYSIGEGRLLVQQDNGYRTSNKGDDPSKVDLLWINQAGEITREENIKLAVPIASSPEDGIWVAAAVAPVPVGWFAGWTLLGPLGLLDQHQADSYQDAFAKTSKFAGKPTLALFVLGLLLAMFVWWKHKQRCGSWAVMWAGLVFLLGPAGLIAYTWHWRRAPTEYCPACDRTVPRNREQCPACHAEWPEPQALGIEVFA